MKTGRHRWHRGDDRLLLAGARGGHLRSPCWSDYRPAEQPDHVLVWHHKNRKTEKVTIPVRRGRDTALARNDDTA
jgi:hypothetical protein